MFNRSEILRAAWTRYRADAALIGLTSFSRRYFAAALRMAWYDAKQMAYFVALEAEEAAEAIANPARAEAKAELTFLNMKDRWTSADYARASSLNRAIAA